MFQLVLVGREMLAHSLEGPIPRWACCGRRALHAASAYASELELGRQRCEEKPGEVQ